MSELDKYTSYKTNLSVVAFLRCQGKILLLKRAMTKKVDPGKYTGVGGKVEPGESFVDAVVREVQEETGLTISSEKLVPNGIFQIADPENDAEWVITAFMVETDEEVKIEPSEDGEFHWLRPEKLTGLPVLPDVADYLETITKNPRAFVLTYIKYDGRGNVIAKNTSTY